MNGAFAEHGLRGFFPDPLALQGNTPCECPGRTHEIGKCIFDINDRAENLTFELTAQTDLAQATQTMERDGRACEVFYDLRKTISFVHHDVSWSLGGPKERVDQMLSYSPSFGQDLA